jgi:uncharacterized protein (DUF58 family)
VTGTSSAPKLINLFDPQLLASLAGLDFKARYLVEGFLQGIHDSPFHGFSVEFSEYRDYQPGDDLRHVDWRLYARHDRLYVKLFQQETNTRFYLVCDTSGSMGYRGELAWGSKLEVACAVGAAMSTLLLRQNDAVGLLSGGDGGEPPHFIRPSLKPSQFGVLLHHLQELRPAGGPRLRQLLEHAARLIHRRSVMLLFTDLLESADEIATALQQLRFLGHECLVFQILDRDEIEFPFSDAAVFEDLEHSVRRAVDPSAAREQYLARFRAFMERHAEQLRGLEMQQCLIRTDEDPWHAIARLLHERRRML